MPSLIDQAIAILRQSRHAVALTGAGISTPSGIPDFRSRDSGLWEKYDPMEVASFTGFKQNPQDFYHWIRPLFDTITVAQPNAAHQALVQLEAYGPLQAVITQNIDGLHSKAGSQTVYEIHGHLREVTCLRCYEIFNTNVVLDDYLATGDIPRCPSCGGVLKPNVILFGELLPVTALNHSRKETRSCDVMLVVGSSLEVEPAGDLPLLAKQSGARLIIVTLSETHLDYLADVVIHTDVVDVLPQLAAPFLP
ncbi:MAG: NAD-dependent deacylase [Ardenticatenaceae bacterium]|nr:NAD-dependent deacylase [Ardenticatenaceae bacterium]